MDAHLARSGLVFRVPLLPIETTSSGKAILLYIGAVFPGKGTVAGFWIVAERSDHAFTSLLRILALGVFSHAT